MDRTIKDCRRSIRKAMRFCKTFRGQRGVKRRWGERWNRSNFITRKNTRLRRLSRGRQAEGGHLELGHFELAVFEDHILVCWAQVPIQLGSGSLDIHLKAGHHHLRGTHLTLGAFHIHPGVLDVHLGSLEVHLGSLEVHFGDLEGGYLYLGRVAFQAGSSSLANQLSLGQLTLQELHIQLASFELQVSGRLFNGDISSLEVTLDEVQGHVCLDFGGQRGLHALARGGHPEGGHLELGHFELAVFGSHVLFSHCLVHL
jgi:hypothetical protein